MATDMTPNVTSIVSEPKTLADEYRPSVDHLVTEDDTPVDNIFSEKQQRLLTEPLYSSWQATVPFLALANVGMFHSIHQPPFVPDMFLSLNVEAPVDLFPKSNRSYFVWEYGKPPDVVIEIVSNREGNEDTAKIDGYARIGVPFYIIYDPELWLRFEPLRCYELRAGRYHLQSISTFLIKDIGLGLTLWNGVFEGNQNQWLRWTNLEGQLIPTGAESTETERYKTELERQRADQERQRADQERWHLDGNRSHQGLGHQPPAWTVHNRWKQPVLCGDRPRDGNRTLEN